MYIAFGWERARKGSSFSAEAFSALQHQQQRLVRRYQLMSRWHLFSYTVTFGVLLFGGAPLLKHHILLLLRQFYRSSRIWFARVRSSSKTAL